MENISPATSSNTHKETPEEKHLRVKKEKRKSLLIMLAGVLIIAVSIWYTKTRTEPEPQKIVKTDEAGNIVEELSLPGEKFASQGRGHMADGQSAEYNSLPPTSGTHFSSQTNWGIHKEPIPEGYQVHNLEHGGIIMQYKPPHLLSAEEIEKCKASSSSDESNVSGEISPSKTGAGAADDKCGGKPDISQEVVDKLKAIGDSYDWKKLILAPYPALAEKNDKNIALTAWTYLDKFDDFDEQRIRAFIDAYRNHGPENVPDNMQSVNLP